MTLTKVKFCNHKKRDYLLTRIKTKYRFGEKIAEIMENHVINRKLFYLCTARKEMILLFAEPWSGLCNICLYTV